jgi:hypothetical protein
MEEIADKPRVTKRKPGRPKIRTGERLSQTLAFRVTYQEAMGLKAKARAAGLEWRDYLRALVRKDLEAKPLPIDPISPIPPA